MLVIEIKAFFKKMVLVHALKLDCDVPMNCLIVDIRGLTNGTPAINHK